MIYFRSQIDFDIKESFGNRADIIKNTQDDEQLVLIVNEAYCLLLISRYDGTHQREDPSCDHHLLWKEPPNNVLLVKKFRDKEVTMKFKEIAQWLIGVMIILIL